MTGEGLLVKSRVFAVLTTIHPPTDYTRALAKRLEPTGGQIVVVGDRKGPSSYVLPATTFLSYRDQLAMPLSLAKSLPVDHYSRKNIGYLKAISEAATLIYETDDDTAPNELWQIRSRETSAITAPSKSGWLNVFRLFTAENIWPRGFPLRAINDKSTLLAQHDLPPVASVIAPVQQGLIDISPDVDSVWRLVFNREFRFSRGPSIQVPPGTWCPFNSQTTWWWPEAYPLLYLPSYCSFRMTDIWRGLIAQRCLWEIERGVVFHAPETNQIRNVHDLMRDFEDEVPGYLGNDRLVAILEKLRLEPGFACVTGNLNRCYRGLVDGGFFPAKEMDLLTGWLHDLDKVGWKCEVA